MYRLIQYSGDLMGKLKKKYLFLFIIVFIGIIVGIIFSNILNNVDKKIVYEKLTTFFGNIKDNQSINYLTNLIDNLKNNFIYLVVIWILGLSIIGLLLNNFILFMKSFILGFSIGSIINIYLYSGLILAFIYCFPTIILNIFVYIIMTYYANDFSIKLFHLIFMKKDYRLHQDIKKYTKLLGILSIILLLSSLYETFITPLTIKLFSFLIK